MPSGRAALKAELIDQLQLTPLLHKRVGVLSKGQAKRALLAFGLLTPQPILMIDEPFEGLDLKQTREASATLRECAGIVSEDGAWEPAWEDLVVHALYDGDEIEPWESVLTIEGDYAHFCHLETVYLGSLARRSLVATNVREVVRAAAPKPMPTRCRPEQTVR